MFVAALQDATGFVDQHRHAAEAYLRVSKDTLSVDELVAMMDDPGVEFTIRPQGMQGTADFMAKTGAITGR